jgi:hypothetical protein
LILNDLTMVCGGFWDGSLSGQITDQGSELIRTARLMCHAERSEASDGVFVFLDPTPGPSPTGRGDARGLILNE